MIDAYLLAGSVRQARATAEIDWRWPRATPGPGGRTRYVNMETGELVEVISSAQDLRGVSIGTKVYLGFGAHGRDDFRLVAMLRDAGRIVTL